MARAAAAPRAWQRMLSGRRLDLLDPSPLDVEIEDIAVGLARVARWNGQTHGPHVFSVAQHALFVEAIARHLRDGLPPAACLAILLHDAAEYVIGDMISPFKAVIGGSYKAIESRIQDAVMQRFSLPRAMPPDIAALSKQADVIAAHHEAVHLAGFSLKEAAQYFGKPVGLPPALLRMLGPSDVKAVEAAFRARFDLLFSLSES